MNLPAAKLSDMQGPVREADIFDKTPWLCSEMLALSNRFRDATTKLEASRSVKAVTGMIHAYLELETIRDQSSRLLESLQKAIETEQKRAAQ